jgi:predicted HAD superfamily Cof-like phosphohydrolase
MNKGQFRVREFHAKFGLTIGETPAIREPELRARLLLEECFETVDALLGEDAVDAVNAAYEAWQERDYGGGQDLAGVADGLADMKYIIDGTAVACGIDLEPIEDAVHVSNMAKDGGPKRADGKILKPEGWVSPNVAGLLRAQGWDGK